MSICQTCQANEPRPTTHAHLTREFYRVLIHPLRFVARKHGYALTVHGSLGEDIDLVAVPWRTHCTSQEAVADDIRRTTEAIIGTARMRSCDPNPMKKPCGRLTWSFYLGPEGCDAPYIDLSVMPEMPEALVPTPTASESKC